MLSVIILPGILTCDENTDEVAEFAIARVALMSHECASPDSRHECDISDTSACCEYQPRIWYSSHRSKYQVDKYEYLRVFVLHSRRIQTLRHPTTDSECRYNNHKDTRVTYLLYVVL